MCVVTVNGSVFSLLATVSWVDLETATLTPKGGMMTVPGLVANTSMNQRCTVQLSPLRRSEAFAAKS